LSCAGATLAAGAASLGLALGGCGDSADSGAGDDAGALEAYVAEVEPIRLGTNDLLDKADPILGAYADHEIGAGEAQRRVEALERRLAGYAVDIAAVDDVPAEMQAAHDAYAHTWILEDSYISALTEAVPEREFDELPDTQDEQRAAIIAWRTRLGVVAARLGVDLPRDIQVAGRGEIAPSPVGE
jgi:hypothetical protein